MANLPPTDSERIQQIEAALAALKKEYDEHLVVANRWSLAFVAWAAWATVAIGVIFW